LYKFIFSFENYIFKLIEEIDISDEFIGKKYFTNENLTIMNYILQANSLFKEKHIPCVYTYYDELTIILYFYVKF